MTRLRLLPVVIFATFALLVLKSVGLITEGGYVFVGSQTAQAQTEVADAGGNTPAVSDAIRVRNEEAADRAAETLFSRAAPAPISSNKIDAVPMRETKLGDKIPVGSPAGVDETEKAVLERLGERRTALEIREQQLEARTSLVEAAELRLADRIAGLEAVEKRINALVDEKKALDNEQFAGVVGMYETMKATDAAAIFDSLEMDVLLRVVRSMNPRKMAPVLAKMDTKRATDLTLMLAEVEPEPELDVPLDSLDDLPQIVGK